MVKLLKCLCIVFFNYKVCKHCAKSVSFNFDEYICFVVWVDALRNARNCT